MKKYWYFASYSCVQDVNFQGLTMPQNVVGNGEVWLSQEITHFEQVDKILKPKVVKSIEGRNHIILGFTLLRVER